MSVVMHLVLTVLAQCLSLLGLFPLFVAAYLLMLRRRKKHEVRDISRAASSSSTSPAARWS
jgi:hypothetical protein